MPLKSSGYFRIVPHLNRFGFCNTGIFGNPVDQASLPNGGADCQAEGFPEISRQCTSVSWSCELIIQFSVIVIWEVSGLLIQAAIAIYCAVATIESEFGVVLKSNALDYSKLALIISAELLPTYALVWMFMYASSVHFS